MTGDFFRFCYTVICQFHLIFPEMVVRVSQTRLPSLEMWYGVGTCVDKMRLL